jgi:hypothetical protein
LLLVTFQFALVACGCLQVYFENHGKLGQVAAFYSRLASADGGFNFYAPSVSAPFRAQFEVEEANGRHFTAHLSDGMGFARTHSETMVAWFWVAATNPKLKRSIVASWASDMFSRFPSASKIGVTIEMYDLPTMANYRAGARPSWKPVYEANFNRG